MSTNFLKTLSFLFTVLLMAAPVFAQTDTPLLNTENDTIAYGDIVSGIITEEDFFNHWYFQGQTGDTIEVVMRSQDTLMPLVGILDESRDLLARSDMNPDGSELATPAPGGTAGFQFTIPADGEYIIVATRMGNADGLSTGAYELGLREIEIEDRVNDLAPVTFRCGEPIVTSAIILDFSPSQQSTTIRLTVFGLDGFQPVINLEATISNVPEGFSDCNGNAESMVGDTLTMPDGTVAAILEDSPESDYFGGAATSAQITLGSIAENMETIKAIIASVDGLPGSYVAVLEGLTLDANEQKQYLRVQMGPANQTSDLLVYMLAGENRIDPYMEISYPDLLADTTSTLVCDDLGLRECSTVPSLGQFAIRLDDGAIAITPDRFDAGLYLNPASIEPIDINLENRARRAEGEFILVFMGTLPESSTTAED